MENTIYRLDFGGAKFEIFVAKSNDEDKETRELGFAIVGKDLELQGGVDENGLDSLISFLQDCEEYITEYNSPDQEIETKTKPK